MSLFLSYGFPTTANAIFEHQTIATVDTFMIINRIDPYC